MPELSLWHRIVGIAVVSLAAILYIVSSVEDETHLPPTQSATPRNANEAVYQHAVTAGHRIVGLDQSKEGELTINTRPNLWSQSTFLLESYAFLKRVYDDPRCDPVQTIKLYPLAQTQNGDAAFAELILTRESAANIDLSQPFPNLKTFRSQLTEHARLAFAPGALP